MADHVLWRDLFNELKNLLVAELGLNLPVSDETEVRLDQFRGLVAKARGQVDALPGQSARPQVLRDHRRARLDAVVRLALCLSRVLVSHGSPCALRERQEPCRFAPNP